MRRISPAASEKKSFENVDDGRRIPLYTKSSPMAFGSGELIKNSCFLILGDVMETDLTQKSSSINIVVLNINFTVKLRWYMSL